MSSPIVRKKRNFRDLQLSVAPPPPPVPEPELVPTRRAPGAGKRKPPAMDLSRDDGGTVVVTTAAPSSAPATSQRSTYQGMLSERIADMDLNAPEKEDKIDVKPEDLREIGELGQGNGGSVKKVEHIPTGKIMAKKIVLIDAKPSVRKQILRELQIMYTCTSPYIVTFHGAFVADPNICICMEYMDKGSLDGIYKRIGAIDIEVVGKIALAVLEGLTYLYEVHHIIHRDIKPSNILFNSQGQIKICDFGVSGELINSIADTFVGTSTYMSPERIQGAQYAVKSDVWSLGISLIELALGRFPFADAGDDSDLSDLESTLSPQRQAPPLGGIVGGMTSKKEKRKSNGVSLQGGGMTMSILKLLQHIVNEPAPRLTPEGRFSRDAEDFVDQCLMKDPHLRPTPKELLNHPWIAESRAQEFDLEAWASTV